MIVCWHDDILRVNILQRKRRPGPPCCPRHTTLSRHNAAVMAWILCSVSPLISLEIPLDGKSELKEDSSKTHKKEHGNSEYGFIRMPPKMVKRGRPKGAELTVIGLPKSKRRKEESNKLLPFSKLHPNDKSRIILECLSSQLAAAEALSGKRLLNEEDVKCNIHLITDTIRDTQNVDVHRVQKYFTSKGWLVVLSVLKEKENSEWFCPICDKVISSTQNSIACDRCLLWCHFSCTTLTKCGNVATGFARAEKSSISKAIATQGHSARATTKKNFFLKQLLIRWFLLCVHDSSRLET